jgi:hypothetical protein
MKKPAKKKTAPKPKAPPQKVTALAGLLAWPKKGAK